MSVLPMQPPQKASAAAITPTRERDFPEWFQQIIKEADLAENSQIRGCMVMKPDGYAIWESIQNKFDPLLKAHGVKNAAFPVFIPIEYFQREAKHAEGFATEVAVVTHRRLEKNKEGLLVPTAPLEEPLIVRPTSEMIIGDSMSRWIKSHRDLPMKLNQWCSVVRMEMRPRLFLRTTEFWWHEGHSAHASAADAQQHTLEMFKLYERFMVDLLALPLIPGEKIATERFAGAERTFTLEAIMQDNKALQAGTSHYLGQNFAKAMNIQFQNSTGELEHAFTTSWGMSTRLIGAMIMCHGDDDGLRLPPRIAPLHVMVLPIIVKEESRSQVLAFAERIKRELGAISYHGTPLRVEVDTRDIRGGQKSWEAIKKGVPLRIEVGPKEVEAGQVVLHRRDLPTGSKGLFKLEDVVHNISALLDEQQRNLLEQGQRRLASNIRTDIRNVEMLKAHFAGDEEGTGRPSWVRAPWSGDPSSLDLLKPLKVTVRCMPLDQSGNSGTCVLTGAPARDEVILARAY